MEGIGPFRYCGGVGRRIWIAYTCAQYVTRMPIACQKARVCPKRPCVHAESTVRVPKGFRARRIVLVCAHVPKQKSNLLIFHSNFIPNHFKTLSNFTKPFIMISVIWKSWRSNFRFKFLLGLLKNLHFGPKMHLNQTFIFLNF